MTTLSAAIIARDEADYIADCLRSLAGIADEVIVLLDHRSTDATAAIALGLGAHVYIAPWRGFPAQRNTALGLCHGEWTLFIDADERVSAPLAQELRAALASDPQHAGFWLPRYNLFFGHQMHGGGWYPDHQLRLLRRGHAHYDETRLVHEFAELHGTEGYLHQHLIHYNVETLDELWRKQRMYALAEAQTLYLQGQRAKRRNFLARPLREFWRRYVQLQGWRDGRIGLLLCATLAWFELVKFVHLRGLATAQGQGEL